MSNSDHNLSGRGFGPYEFALGDELRGERATLGRSLLDVQRDLRIKAAYIAAIENAEPEVFSNPGFIPGYVRSYARYLGLDPDEVYFRFCQESGFAGAHGASWQSSVRGSASGTSVRAPVHSLGGFRPDFPMARVPRIGIGDIPVSAIGSLLVLVCLVAGLGYGGWTVLQNIQRVQFAPIEEMPLAVAEVETLQPPAGQAPGEPTMNELATPVSATALTELYRQQELEVPILTPRDGPIAGLDPDRTGLLAGRGVTSVPISPEKVVPAAPQAAGATAVVIPAVAEDPQVVAVSTRPAVTVVAERAAWIRVYLADSTVIFERILETGETYSPPDDVASPMIWAGNSGSVYVRVGDDLHGPLGRGTRAAKDVVLDPKSIVKLFGKVEAVPEVISQTLGKATDAAPTTVAIQ